MTQRSAFAPRDAASLEVYLLGQVDFELALALQQRLVYEAAEAPEQIRLLLCEHPASITVGRQGSRAHIHLPPGELTSRQVKVHWASRGGPCLVHLAGQLAVYPIVPLCWHGFTVGDFLRRFQRGLAETLAAVGAAARPRPGSFGLWGRSGQLVAVGAAVKNWTTYHGAFVNVDPPLELFRAVDTDPELGTPFSSLVAERQQPVKMTAVRASLVGTLAAAFDCRRHHLYNGHPLLARLAKARHESSARAS